MTDYEKELASKVAVKVPQPDSVIEVKVSPPGGDIEVQVDPSGDSIEVRISPGGRLVEVRIGPPLSLEADQNTPILPVKADSPEIGLDPLQAPADDAKLCPNEDVDNANVVEIQDEEEVLELEPADLSLAEYDVSADDASGNGVDLLFEAKSPPPKTDTLWVDEASESLEDELDRELINEALNAEPVLEDDQALEELQASAVLAEIADETPIIEDEEPITPEPDNLEASCGEVPENESAKAEQNPITAENVELSDLLTEHLLEGEEQLVVEENAVAVDESLIASTVVEEDEMVPVSDDAEISIVPAVDNLEDLWSEVLEADAAEITQTQTAEESVDIGEPAAEFLVKEDTTAEDLVTDDNLTAVSDISEAAFEADAAEEVAGTVLADEEELIVVEPEAQDIDVAEIEPVEITVEKTAPVLDDLEDLWSEVLEADAAETEIPEKDKEEGGILTADIAPEPPKVSRTLKARMLHASLRKIKKH